MHRLVRRKRRHHTGEHPGNTPRGRRRARRGDQGYATAEAALALPALFVVLALAVAVVVSVGAQLRCVDAARAAARVVARGDSDSAAIREAVSIAPRGARVRIRHHDGQVEVLVEVDLRATRWLPAIPVSARAVAEAEGP